MFDNFSWLFAAAQRAAGGKLSFLSRDKKDEKTRQRAECPLDSRNAPLQAR